MMLGAGQPSSGREGAAVGVVVIAECRQHYAQARNQVDTLRIDGLVPERADRASSAMRCGDLRRAYPEVTPRQ